MRTACVITVMPVSKRVAALTTGKPSAKRATCVANQSIYITANFLNIASRLLWEKAKEMHCAKPLVRDFLIRGWICGAIDIRVARINTRKLTRRPTSCKIQVASDAKLGMWGFENDGCTYLDI